MHIVPYMAHTGFFLLFVFKITDIFQNYMHGQIRHEKAYKNYVRCSPLGLKLCWLLRIISLIL